MKTMNYELGTVRYRKLGLKLFFFLLVFDVVILIFIKLVAWYSGDRMKYEVKLP